MLTLYGLKSCDTVRAARKALDGAGVAYSFHDVRSDGLDQAQVCSMLDALGADALVNRRGTTFRGLSDDEKAAADGKGVASLLVDHPAIIKRPVWERDGVFKLGFRPADRDALIAWAAGDG